jgi:Protein of unknown function (DUF433)
LRFPVSRLLGLLAAGETRESILKTYPYLEAADIDAALLYASALAEDEPWNSLAELAEWLRLQGHDAVHAPPTRRSSMRPFRRPEPSLLQILTSRGYWTCSELQGLAACCCAVEISPNMSVKVGWADRLR